MRRDPYERVQHSASVYSDSVTANRRLPGAAREFVLDLRAIADPDAAWSVSIILDMGEGTQRARSSLAATFDDPPVTELAAYSLGDGGA